MTNLTNCSDFFLNSYATLPRAYIWDGPVAGPFDKTIRPPFVSLRGCLNICGTGNDYYPWKDASATITTWILPVIGLLLQAPYESNDFWRTLRALARWIGSPIASLSYTLWNIKVTGKCALMVDMATRYEVIPGEGSQFAQIRDSLYILSVMNQYEVKQRMPAIEAERLLRVALFSDSLKLTPVEGRPSNLVRRRYELAASVRKGRKKGVVPVFISLMWFLFSLAISIQQAFGDIGANQTAHNMALGCLLSWLPVLILTGIVDRNPVAAESILVELNAILDEVRSALLDENLRNTYIQDTGRTQEDFAWTNALNNEDYFHQNFFTGFAGQGRVRWHYGVAHSILAGLESTFMAAARRDWLRDAERARTAMVLGPEKTAGLRWFDFRMLWQIFSSVCIVCGTAGGAFILSYFTPTVGLGCRSGGYLIFFVIALGIFSVEVLIWWCMPDGTKSPRWFRKYMPGDPISHWGSNVENRLSRADSNGWGSILVTKFRVRKILRWVDSLSFRKCIEVFVLDPSELINSIWLTYIVFAQTFGAYRNCNCMASTWGRSGGYIDFKSYEYYSEHGVEYYWGFGIGLSLVVMCAAFAFIVAEFGTQSHLSTVNYEKAAHGLRWTRRFKKYTFLFRSVPNSLIELGKYVCHKILGRNFRRERRSLVWTWRTGGDLEIPTGEADESRLHGPIGGGLGGNHASHGRESDDSDSAEILLQRLPSVQLEDN